MPQALRGWRSRTRDATIDTLDARKLHSEVNLAGFRAHAAAIGLLQLVRELRCVEVIDNAAVGRVRDAVIDDLSLSRSVHSGEREFRDHLKVRLDRLMGIEPER